MRNNQRARQLPHVVEAFARQFRCRVVHSFVQVVTGVVAVVVVVVALWWVGD